jgi:type II secretory pathway component PulC
VEVFHLNNVQLDLAYDAVNTMVAVKPNQKLQQERDKAANLYKSMHNFLEMSGVAVEPLTEADLVKYSLPQLEKEMESILKTTLKTIVKFSSSELGRVVIVERESDHKYSTGDVAKFLNTTIQTVHNWIRNGRIHGVDKPTEKFQQVRIPETAKYKTASGEWVLIKEFAEIYKKSSISKPDTANKNVLSELIENLQFFQNKYNGTYEEVFGGVDLSTLSNKDRSHAMEWKFLKDEIDKRNNVT